MSNPKSILISQIQQLAGVEGVELIMIEPCENNYMLCHIYFDPDSVVDRLTPEEVQRRNYEATVKRGLINGKTKKEDFFNKMYEELADISLVCDAYAYHYGIDLQAEKEKKMLINEKRID